MKPLKNPRKTHQGTHAANIGSKGALLYALINPNTDTGIMTADALRLDKSEYRHWEHDRRGKSLNDPKREKVSWLVDNNVGHSEKESIVC